MARKTHVVLIDDIDGGTADETVRFALDGDEYEIDLSNAHLDELRAALEPFIAGGRKVSVRRARRPRGAAVGSSVGRSAEIRRWAADVGIPVNARGRIPADVVAKYDAAHA
jgi:hypothetical protein